jgi:hypothetical protein
MENEKQIRSVGAIFALGSDLKQGNYSMSFKARCSEVSKKDNDDRAIYSDGKVRTVLAASQLVGPYGLKEKDNLPATVSFAVAEKGRISFNVE